MQKSKYIWFLLFVIISFHQVGIAQSNYNRDLKVDFSQTNITVPEDIAEELKAQVTDILLKYHNNADFYDSSDGRVTTDKISVIGGIFDNNAFVMNDLVKSGKMIGVADYVDIVLNFLLTTGVDFSMDNVFCDELKKGDSGYYLATVYAEKIVYTGLNKDNTPKTITDGRKFDMTFTIAIPTYNLADGKITTLTADNMDKASDAFTSISVDATYGRGTVFGQSAIPGFDAIIGNFNSTVVNYGLGFTYRTNIKNSTNKFINLGLRMARIAVQTDISSFNATSSNAFGYNDYLTANDGETVLFVDINNDGIVTSPTSNDTGSLNYALVKPSTISNGSEKISTWLVEIPLGISLLMKESYSSRLYLDLSLVPQFRLGYSGTMNGNIQGLKIPVSEHFPTVEELQANGIINSDFTSNVPEYAANEALDDQGLEGSGLFSLGAKISPSYQILSSFNSGIEVGLDMYFDILPAFNNKTYNNDFITADNFERLDDRQNVIHEDLFDGSKFFTVGFKIGYYYEFR